MSEFTNPKIVEILGDEPSGIKLSGSTNNKGFFNVKPWFNRAQVTQKHGGKKYDWSFCNPDEIAYVDGYAFITDGWTLIANKENYSPIYEHCAVDMLDNKIYPNIGVQKADCVAMMEELGLIDVGRLFAYIEAQQKEYKSITDKEIKSLWRNNKIGGVGIAKCKDDIVTLTNKQCRFLKEFKAKFGVDKMTINCERDGVVKVYTKGCFMALMPRLIYEPRLDDIEDAYLPHFITDFSICTPIKK